VNTKVVLQISQLVERLTALFHLANVRSLTGMDSQMIKKVVPLFKGLIASLVKTEHVSHSSIGQRVLGVEHDKLLGLRNQAILL